MRFRHFSQIYNIRHICWNTCSCAYAQCDGDCSLYFCVPSTGSKQTTNRRLTIHNSGDLTIQNTTFGDAGRFFCVVQNVLFYSWIAHDLKIESEFCAIDLVAV